MDIIQQYSNIKKNKTDKMINTIINKTDDNKTNIIKKSFSQKKQFLKRISPNINSKKEIRCQNHSTDSLLNGNFNYYKNKFLYSLYNKNETNIDNSLNIQDNNNNTQKNNENLHIKNSNNSSRNYDNYFLVKKFLEQNISKNIGYKLLSKYLHPIQLKPKEIKITDKVFTMKKKKVFEKEIFHLSLYDNFNYKGSQPKRNNIVNIQNVNGNNTSIINDNINLGALVFPSLRKISDLDKVLIKDDKRNSNGNSFYKDHDEEKKETIIKVIDNDNSIKLIKKNLTKIKHTGESGDEEGEIENKQFEDPNYLRKIISKNKIKNRSLGDINLNIFDTYDQKNKKVLIAINENYKKKKRNKSLDENLKSMHKDEKYLRKEKLNRLSNRMNLISHQLYGLNQKLDGYLKCVKNVLNKDVKSIFD